MHMDFERKCIMSERLTKVLKMSEKYSGLRQIWTSCMGTNIYVFEILFSKIIKLKCEDLFKLHF